MISDQTPAILEIWKATLASGGVLLSQSRPPPSSLLSFRANRRSGGGDNYERKVASSLCVEDSLSQGRRRGISLKKKVMHEEGEM